MKREEIYLGTGGLNIRYNTKIILHVRHKGTNNAYRPSNGPRSDDMSSEQVRTEVPVDGQTVRKYSFVSHIVDLAAARKSLFYH